MNPLTLRDGQNDSGRKLRRIWHRLSLGVCKKYKVAHASRNPRLEVRRAVAASVHRSRRRFCRLGAAQQEDPSLLKL